MSAAVPFLSSLAIPLVVLLLSAVFFTGRAGVTDAFMRGAREGIECAVSLLPTLVLLMVGVGVFRAGGLLDLLAEALAPVFEKIGVPAALLPLLLLRPVSGSASQALLADLFGSVGADSFAGLCGSVIMGSSETVFYVTAVYAGAVRAKHTRHTVPVALAVSALTAVVSVTVCRILY